MLWGRFEADRDKLDLYANPHFMPGSGLVDPDLTYAEITRLADEMEAAGKSRILIKARAFAFVLRHCAVDVNPACWFGANVAGRRVKYVEGANKAIRQLSGRFAREIGRTDAEKAAFEHMEESGATVSGTDHEHWVPDWDAVLRLGFPGLRARAQAYRAALQNPTDEQRDFYEAVDIVYDAAIRFVERLAECARARIGEDERMPMRVKCLETLVKGAPGNIYEAMQLMYIYHLIEQFVECAQCRSLGDIDRLLYPYYLRDLYDGTFTRDQVMELFEYFFLLYDFQKHAYNQPVSIGGVDVFGQPCVNDLTYLVIDAYYASKVINLKIHVFVNPDTPDKLLRRTMDLIRRGNGSFVFMNTDVGVKAMERAYRMPVKPYMLGSQGCYNFNIKGEAAHANQSRINLPKIIELTFNQGVDPLTGFKIGADTPPAEQMATFDDFHAACLAQLDCVIDKCCTICDYSDRTMTETNPAPLMSGTYRFSLEAGRDCFGFGATSILCMGLGTIADCLMMVLKHVYEQREISLSDLRDVLNRDWEGAEDLRARLYDDPEKYGNNLERPDAFAKEIYDHCVKRIYGRPNLRGGQFITHFETINRCFRSGRFTGATPDGRKARTAFSKNLNAGFGQDRRGLTAMLDSVTKLDATYAPIGAPADFMLHPSATSGEDGLTAMVDMLRGFLKMGGYALQGNVMDADTLRDAQKHPERYPTLQVRVSGWNWYFVNMDKESQDAFILQADMLG